MHLILHHLNKEWSELATSLGGRRALERWCSNYPVMRQMADLDDLVTTRRDRSTMDVALRGLAELAKTDEVASRALLQAMLPGLIRVASFEVVRDPDAMDEIITIAWELISAYPLQRPGSVPANIVLDVRKHYRRERFVSGLLSIEVLPELPSTASSPEDRALARLRLEEVRTARDQGIVNEVAFDAVVRTRVEGYTLAEVGALHGMEASVIHQRRWRAERRLRELSIAA